MLKPLLACVLTACVAATSFAAVDANTATEATCERLNWIPRLLNGRIIRTYTVHYSRVCRRCQW